MMRLSKLLMTFFFAVSFLMPPVAQAQEYGAAPIFTEQQVNQLVAPIALYPDPLLAQIFMASTYPLEIVEAQRWLQNSQNAQLRGDQLTYALMQQPWDPSVKALVSFPQVLTMLNNNLRWTEQLGDAFLGQQAEVMDSVQHLRQLAEESGNLTSTPQQTVSYNGDVIDIMPADPDVMYVPYYTSSVYGAWPYPDYPPDYFAYPQGYYSNAAGIIGFGTGIAVVTSLWGWNWWDWHHHRIDIDDRRFERINRNLPPPVSGRWTHEPEHRHGVPYRNFDERSRFYHDADQDRREFRGYPTQATYWAIDNRPIQTERRFHNREERTQFDRQPRFTPQAQPDLVPQASPHLIPAALPQLIPAAQPHLVPQAEPYLVPQAQPVVGTLIERQLAQSRQEAPHRTTAPVFESFSRERGSYNHSSAPMPTPVRGPPVNVQGQPAQQRQPHEHNHDRNDHRDDRGGALGPR